ncbi:hypothetical protein COOONC_16828 [Cooperia oncophora]
MENGVDFVAAWLACAKIGVISAWINTNLRKEALAQSLTSSRASVVLCSSSLQQALVEMIESGTTSMRPLVIFSRGSPNEPNIKPIQRLLQEQPSSQPTSQRRMSFQDPLCLTYSTSGTNRMPNAALIKHLGIGQTIIHGATCVIREKFPRKNPLISGKTVSHTDVRYVREAKVSQYIGELLRYLLLTEKSPCFMKTNHCVRLLMGNGLR